PSSLSSVSAARRSYPGRSRRRDGLEAALGAVSGLTAWSAGGSVAAGVPSRARSGTRAAEVPLPPGSGRSRPRATGLALSWPAFVTLRPWGAIAPVPIADGYANAYGAPTTASPVRGTWRQPDRTP